jgi:quinoprotein glucose dehydrogenase
MDPNGYPGTKPPWGSLAAVDLSVGEIKWSIPLGEYPVLVEQGIRNTGSINFGGAVATAGGVIFIGATADEKFRAFESATGKLLWEYQLPYGGHATPSVFMVEGRQYVAICAGGTPKVGTPSGDVLVVFSLPESR